jgi:hypothetical protein
VNKSKNGGRLVLMFYLSFLTGQRIKDGVGRCGWKDFEIRLTETKALRCTGSQNFEGGIHCGVRLSVSSVLLSLVQPWSSSNVLYLCFSFKSDSKMCDKTFALLSE